MERLEVQTRLGPVVAWGRLTGRPAFVVVTGVSADIGTLDHLQGHLSGIDVLRLHLPGNHCPRLSEIGVEAIAAAFTEALDGLLGDRPVIVMGISAGAVVALTMQPKGLRNLLLLDPPLTNQDLWPLEGAEGLEDVLTLPNYRPSLGSLYVPATVIVGDTLLEPRRDLPEMPSLVTPEDRLLLKAHPLVRYIEVAGGHHVLRAAPMAVFSSIRDACLELARDLERADEGDVDAPQPART